MVRIASAKLTGPILITYNEPPESNVRPQTLERTALIEYRSRITLCPNLKFIFRCLLLPPARLASAVPVAQEEVQVKAKIVCRICQRPAGRPSPPHLCHCVRGRSTNTRACASTDCFPARAANRELYRGNENSTVRWAAPTPQMYSVGGLTCIYETRARSRAPTASVGKCTHTGQGARTRACATPAYKPRRRDGWSFVASTYHSIHPLFSLSLSSRYPKSPTHPPSLCLPLSLCCLFCAAIQSSASYDLYLVIPSV